MTGQDDPRMYADYYLLKAGTFPIHLPATYPIHNCQRNAHVESAVSKVNSLWAIDKNAIVE